MKDAAATALHSAQDLASAALDLIGIRYKWGGNSPETGLDCSGLVRYVFQQVTGVTLPRTAKDMSHVGTQVAASDLQPGDLVFFNTRRFAFSHVGIYLGDNRFIHAPRRGREVEIATFDSGFWQQRFNGARRMAGVHARPHPVVRRRGHGRAAGGLRERRSRTPDGRPGPRFSAPRRAAAGRPSPVPCPAAPSRARWRRCRCGD